MTDEEKRFAQAFGHVRLLDRELADFEDTAAVLALAERVVSVDTVVAHVAGIVGRPATILLPYSADFRWGVEGDTSRYYPSFTLMRQRAPGVWDDVFQSLVAEMA